MLPPKALGNNLSLPLPASNLWYFLILWQHHSNICLCLQMVPSLCVHVQISPSYKDTSHWIRAHLNLVWPHFNLIALQKPSFQIRSWSWVQGVNTWTYLLGITQFNPLHPLIRTRQEARGILTIKRFFDCQFLGTQNIYYNQHHKIPIFTEHLLSAKHCAIWYEFYC